MRKLRPSVGTFPRGFTVNTFIAAFFSTSPPLRHRVASQASCHCPTRQNNKLTHKLRMCFFLHLTHCYTALSSQLPHILRNCILSLNFRLEVRWHLNCTERKQPRLVHITGSPLHPALGRLVFGVVSTKKAKSASHTSALASLAP